MKILCLQCKKTDTYRNPNASCSKCGHNFIEGDWVEKFNFFKFSLPKYHNLITSIIRLSVFILFFLFMWFPPAILFEGISVSIGLLYLTIYGIFVFWPTLKIFSKTINKIKVGKHYSERISQFKMVLKKLFNQTDYISEIERLSIMKDEGIITDEEFKTKKKKLLI